MWCEDYMHILVDAGVSGMEPAVRVLQTDPRGHLCGLRGAVTLHVHGGHVVSPVDIRKKTEQGFGTRAVRWFLFG